MASDSAVLSGNALHQALMANAHAVDPDPAPAQDTDDLPIFSNWELDESGPKPRRRGLALQDICHELYDLTGGWPKRVDNSLFVPGANHAPRFLESPPQLFAWLAPQAHPDWAQGSDMITQETFLAHLQETAERFDAIERFPHWPPLADTYYMHPPLPDHTDGEYLDALVERFTPLTGTDRQLIRAFIVGLAWGGPPGARPAWLFTAPDDDPLGGRGVGKSKIIELVGELFGGMLEVSPNEDIIAIKKRLLSPAARTLRLCRIDNIKSFRFSWADLEGLITSPVISGHRMYKGEGRRPNTLTWALTLNGASLSKDLAKRVIVVKLQRPTYCPTWEAETRALIQQFRWQIFNDIRLFLES
jgi:hypothetical protein